MPAGVSGGNADQPPTMPKAQPEVDQHGQRQHNMHQAKKGTMARPRYFSPYDAEGKLGNSCGKGGADP